MNALGHLLRLSVICIPILLSACTLPPIDYKAKEPPRPIPEDQITGYFTNTGDGVPWYLAKWQDDPSLPGDLLLVVDKKKQMIYVYRGATKVAYTPVSTGKNPASTPNGTFRISEKIKDHHSYYGNFISPNGSRSADSRTQSAQDGESFSPTQMPFFMRVTGNVGIHSGYLPGHPDSHGCIRLPRPFAIDLYGITPIGTKVIITDKEWHIYDFVPKAAVQPPAVKQATPTPTAF